MELKRCGSFAASEDELEQAYKRFRRMKQDNACLDRRLETIGKQLKALTRSRWDLDEERERLQKGDALKDAIHNYSRLANRKLAEKMQSTLPRELRDEIYTYLWETSIESHVKPTSRPDDLAKIFREMCPGPPCECLRGVELAPWLRPEIVGHATAIENVEALYRLALGMYADSPEMITHQLYADPFHVGFEPLPVIDSFTVEINIDYCLRKQARSLEEEHNPSRVPYSMHTELTKAVNNLLKVPKKRNFALEVTLEQRFIRIQVLAEVLEILKPAIKAFDQEEACIELYFSHRRETKAPYPADAIIETSLLHAIDQDAAQWQKELRDVLDETSWIDTRHRKYLIESEHAFDSRVDVDRRTYREKVYDVERHGLADDGEDPRKLEEQALVNTTVGSSITQNTKTSSGGDEGLRRSTRKRKLP